MAPQTCQTGGAHLEAWQHRPPCLPPVAGDRGGNSLDFKVRGFDFVFITPFVPLVLFLSHHHKEGEVSIQDCGRIR